MKTLEVTQSIDSVRSHWSDAEHLPKFLPAVTKITSFSPTRWLWSADIGGMTKKWMTEVERTETSVEWTPTDGSANWGRVDFRETETGTEITLDMVFDESIWTSDVHRSAAKQGWRVRQVLEAYAEFVEDGETRSDGFRHERERIELQQMTREQLNELAADRKLSGRSKLRKDELVEALLPAGA